MADNAPARWATPRTPGRASYGPAIGRVATALGRRLQPWQQLVADVATEVEPDGTWAYRTVVVHVQRQAGKTTLLGPANVHRCLTRAGVKTWLTAQRRQDGRDTWRDVAELVARSPLAGTMTVRRSNGSEELSCAATGSSFRVFAPSEDALHGKANEAVAVDEAWVFDGPQGIALQQAILPTFTTTGGQLWLTSTAGTAASTWFRQYVERGRAAVESGRRDGIAYFEWSLPPAPAEEVTTILAELQRAGGPVNPQLREQLDRAVELTLSAHPGRFVRADAVRDAALTMAPGEFLRAYGNVWTLTSDRLIADHSWRACADPALAPAEPGQLALAFDVALDRSGAAIAASWQHAGRTVVDVVDARPGTAWLAGRIEQLVERWRAPVVGYDGAGPALDVADELTRRGRVELRRLSTREYVTACAGFLADVDAGQLLHRSTPALDTAVAAAAKRDLGDGWAWSRRSSAGSIAGLVAATVARFAQLHRPEPGPAPLLVVRRQPAPAGRSLV